MTPEEEKAWWLKMVKELREVMNPAQIAAEIGVTERTVFNWQSEGRPMGMKAIRVYLLYLRVVERATRNDPRGTGTETGFSTSTT